ncbi:MAG: malate synthase G, partial [Pseudomonadota bacterium]
MARIDKAGLQWDAELAAFVEIAADGTGVPADDVFAALASLVAEFGPENRALLQTREKLQEQIDDWHRDRAGNPHDPEAYKSYLEGIGYLVPPGPDFQIETANVDPEIASTPGPQLVVPIDNARYAINAANARWGSLYDALYGTDAMGNLPDPGPYDRGRGARVIARARVFLDDAFPLRGASHADVTTYQVADGALLGNGKPLRDPDQFIGYRGEPQAPEAILLRNNGLHTELVFDAQHAIGKRDQAHLADVILEAAITAIVDCEDSVAAVDAADKRRCYANWLGLMKGDLTAEVTKGDQSFTRRLAPDRPWTAPHGTAFEMKGRALLWIRNVGHLMTTPAVLTAAGDEVPEGLLDALMTTLIGKHDLARAGGNSSAGSIYVVKPKMHGPEEVA